MFMEGGIGSAILGIIIWRLTGNFFVGAIASFILWPFFKAILSPIKNSIQMIGVKTPPFYLVMDFDRDNPALIGQGARVLIVTDSEVELLPEDKRLKVYESLYKSGVKKLFAKENFQRRIVTLHKSRLPLQVYVSVTRMGHQGSMRKCFSEWGNMVQADSFSFGDGDRDKDDFIEELTYELEGMNDKLSAIIIFAFDKNIRLDETEAADGFDIDLPASISFTDGLREVIYNNRKL
jgi:hypothetical protein